MYMRDVTANVLSQCVKVSHLSTFPNAQTFELMECRVEDACSALRRRTSAHEA